MHSQARVHPPSGDRVASVNTDPNPDRRTGWPLMARQGPLDLKRAQHSLLRASERNEKRVPLRVHLMATLVRDGGADQLPVLSQDPRVAFPQRLDQPRRTFDVAEQEGDYPTRKPAHAAASRQATSTHRHERQQGATTVMPAAKAIPAPAPPGHSRSALAGRRIIPAGPSCTPGTTTDPPAASHLQA